MRSKGRYEEGRCKRTFACGRCDSSWGFTHISVGDLTGGAGIKCRPWEKPAEKQPVSFCKPHRGTPGWDEAAEFNPTSCLKQGPPCLPLTVFTRIIKMCQGSAHVASKKKKKKVIPGLLRNYST